MPVGRRRHRRRRLPGLRPESLGTPALTSTIGAQSGQAKVPSSRIEDGDHSGGDSVGYWASGMPLALNSVAGKLQLLAGGYSCNRTVWVSDVRSSVKRRSLRSPGRRWWTSRRRRSVTDYFGNRGPNGLFREKFPVETVSFSGGVGLGW